MTRFSERKNVISSFGKRWIESCHCRVSYGIEKNIEVKLREQNYQDIKGMSISDSNDSVVKIDNTST